MQSLVSPIETAEDVPTFEVVRKPPPPKRFRSLPLLIASLGVSASTMGLLALDWAPPKIVGAVGFGTAALLAIAGAFSAIVSLASALPKLRAAQIALLISVLLGNGVMAFIGAVFTVLSVADFRRGRQIRHLGRVLLPPLAPGNGWVRTADSRSVPIEVRDALAHQWRENGRTEHASVAAFARLTLDLIALGAPPSLVRAAQRDALDEIRHTELCFSLAHAIDGRDVGPGAFDVMDGRSHPQSRTLRLARIAVDSLVDGALHEGVSARVIAQLAKRAEDPQMRALLKELAADEGRHAAHGWDVVEWCVKEGGRPVIDALVGAVGALPTAMRSPLPVAAQGGEWERYGIHGHALEAAEYEKARAGTSHRVLTELARVEAA